MQTATQLGDGAGLRPARQLDKIATAIAHMRGVVVTMVMDRQTGEGCMFGGDDGIVSHYTRDIAISARSIAQHLPDQTLESVLRVADVSILVETWPDHIIAVGTRIGDLSRKSFRRSLRNVRRKLERSRDQIDSPSEI